MGLVSVGSASRPPWLQRTMFGADEQVSGGGQSD